MGQATTEDLDLIEAAARAAGYEVRRYRVRELEVAHVREPGGVWRYFNPLKHDADAFALAADMDLFAGPNYWHHLALARLGGGTDKRANVRRAVTSAAAEKLGRRVA